MITAWGEDGERVYDIYLCQTPSPKRAMHEHGEERVLDEAVGHRSVYLAVVALVGRQLRRDKRASLSRFDLGLDNGQDGRGVLALALTALGPVESEGLDGLEGWRGPCMAAAAARLGG